MDTESIISLLHHLIKEQLDVVVKIVTSQHCAFFHISTIEMNDLHLVITDGDYMKSIPWKKIEDAQVYCICATDFR